MNTDVLTCLRCEKSGYYCFCRYPLWDVEKEVKR